MGEHLVFIHQCPNLAFSYVSLPLYFVLFCQQPFYFASSQAGKGGVMGGGTSQMSTFRETQRLTHPWRKHTSQNFLGGELQIIDM